MTERPSYKELAALLGVPRGSVQFLLKANRIVQRGGVWVVLPAKRGRPLQRRPVPTRRTHTATCQTCGAPFETAGRGQYCSDACRYQADYARRRPRCRCGIGGGTIPVYPVPDDLQAAWGAAYVCAVCLREGSKRAA